MAKKVEMKNTNTPQWSKPGVVAYNPKEDCCGLLVICGEAEGGIAIFRVHSMKDGKRLEGEGAVPYEGWEKATEEQCKRYWEMFSMDVYHKAKEKGTVWDTKKGGEE